MKEGNVQRKSLLLVPLIENSTVRAQNLFQSIVGQSDAQKRLVGPRKPIDIVLSIPTKRCFLPPV